MFLFYLGTTTYNPQMIIDTLQLPELVFPLTTITVGYPDGIPAQVDRLSLEAAVHDEKYLILISRILAGEVLSIDFRT